MAAQKASMQVSNHLAPRIERVMETALYCDDPARTQDFYCTVLGLTPLTESDRLRALSVGDSGVLLLFRRTASLGGVRTSGGWIPPHDGAGPVHVAFAVATADLRVWRERLEQAGVAIESEVTWTRGGRSVCFRDPEGHSVELVTPGTWAIY